MSTKKINPAPAVSPENAPAAIYTTIVILLVFVLFSISMRSWLKHSDQYQPVILPG